jgi:CBS domain containing-hemolysin-like protein
MEISVWFGILFCISQSAMFSGLNLAFFSVTRLRLEIEAGSQNKAAIKVLKMRSDSNFLLTTILWGNVGINVLLTLLSNSVMAGLSAFIFSTVFITLMGEIIPQAYFSRHALRMASLLAPVLRMYQLIMYPVAKPSALLLDVWLGKETIQYYKEKSLKQLIHHHVSGDGDVDYVEGIGAINFLSIDDLMVSQEGEPLDPDSIISLVFKNNEPVFPEFEKQTSDLFLARIHRSRRKWVVITDSAGNPRKVLDADGFIRSALLDKFLPDPKNFTHTPIIINDSKMPLGEVLQQFKVEPRHQEDDVIDQDLILVWDDKKQIITGADILGRLMRGITSKLNQI